MTSKDFSERLKEYETTLLLVIDASKFGYFSEQSELSFLYDSLKEEYKWPETCPFTLIFHEDLSYDCTYLFEYIFQEDTTNILFGMQTQEYDSPRKYLKQHKIHEVKVKKIETITFESENKEISVGPIEVSKLTKMK